MIRGRKRALTREIDADMNASIHNRFDIEVVDAGTGRVKRRARAENVICDSLWTYLEKNSNWWAYLHYGSGAGTPGASDTALFSYLGYLSAVNGTTKTRKVNYAGHWVSYQKQYRIAETVAVGSTLTEVGLAYSTSRDLCTHAMLQDMNGNQISIVKTETDVINIYATVFIHWSEDQVSGGIQLIVPPEVRDVNLLDWIVGGGARCAYVQAEPKRYLYGFENSKNYTNVSSVMSAADKTLTMKITRLAVDGANIAGGVYGLMFFGEIRSSSGFKSSYGPSIYLDATKGDWFSGSTITGESVGTGDGATVDFATAFDLPERATVYVDGEMAAATVGKEPLFYNDMGRYFSAVTISDGAAYPAASSGTHESYFGYLSSYYGVSCYYNPFFSMGVDTFNYSRVFFVAVSDDCVNWTYLVGSEDDRSERSGTFQVPKNLRNKKYWRLNDNSFQASVSALTSNALTGKNIHFATPPAAGAVITADYHTPVIAKDADHVFDLTVTIHFGEYRAT